MHLVAEPIERQDMPTRLAALSGDREHDVVDRYRAHHSVAAVGKEVHQRRRRQRRRHARQRKGLRLRGFRQAPPALRRSMHLGVGTADRAASGVEEYQAQASMRRLIPPVGIDAVEPIPQPGTAEWRKHICRLAASSTGRRGRTTCVALVGLSLEDEQEATRVGEHANRCGVGGSRHIDRNIPSIDDDLRDPHVGRCRRGHGTPRAGSDQHVKRFRDGAHGSSS